MSMDVETSIVIRAFNEEEHLPALLASIKSQRYQSFEVVVVDSGSFDRTREIAKEYCDQLLRIRSEDFTFGFSLNTGVRAARGRFIVIVSAHTKALDGDWLGRLVEPLRDENVAMVYGRQLGTPNSKYSEIQDLKRTFSTVRRTLVPPHFFANNANAAIRKNLWEEHVFDETLPGLEDIEWAKYWMERNYRIIYEPEAAIYHIHQESWPQVYRRYYREAVACHLIGLKSRMHLIPTVLSEVGSFASDLSLAAGDRSLLEKWNEICLFRFYKAIGTVRGLLDGSLMQNKVMRDTFLFDRSYRAVVIHGRGRVSLDMVPVPEVKPGDVLVKVAYEGVCATDLHIFEGSLGYYKDGLAKYPIIPGHEFSGTVVRLGSNVSHLGIDDPVVVECIQACGACPACRQQNWIGCKERREVGVIGLNGGYSEFVVVPGRYVHKLPPGVDLRLAAAVEPLAVVHKGLRRLKSVLGTMDSAKRCAVVGAGPIGHLCAKVLSLRGYQVTVFDRDPRRRAYFEGSAVATAVSLDSLRDHELIVEATGDPEALHAILEKSMAGATVLLLGLPYAHREFTFESVVAYDKAIIGSVGSEGEDFEEAIRILPLLNLSPFLERIIPLEQFEKAWAETREKQHLKVLLEIGSSSGSFPREANL